MSPFVAVAAVALALHSLFTLLSSALSVLFRAFCCLVMVDWSLVFISIFSLNAQQFVQHCATYSAHN
jgi:hypothetical protein